MDESATNMVAAADESQTFRGLLGVLRRWWWAILLVTAITTIAAVGYALTQESVFEAKADVLIGRQSLSNSLNNISDPNAQPNEGPRVAQTQAQLATSPVIAVRTIAAMKIKDLTPKDLRDNVTVTPDENSDILHFEMRDKQQNRTAALTNEYAKQYIIYRAAIEQRAISRATAELNATIAKLKSANRDSGTFYDSLRDKRDILKTLGSLPSSNSYITERAETADQVVPRPLVNAVLGVTLGLVLGIGLALLLDAFDPRLRTAESIAARLGLRLLARIPSAGRDELEEPVMQTAPQSQTAEGYRVLRANIDFAAREKPLTTILITSARADEHKSAAAANLAIAFARTGRRITLVSLDLRAAGFDGIFDLSDRAGVTDIVTGSTGISEASYAFAQSSSLAAADEHGAVDGSGGRLRVIPRGTVRVEPGEFVGTPALQSFLSEIAEDEDMVIIDSPGLIDASDAISLAAAADATLLTSTRNQANEADAAEVRRLLANVPSRQLGVAVFE